MKKQHLCVCFIAVCSIYRCFHCNSSRTVRLHRLYIPPLHCLFFFFCYCSCSWGQTAHLLISGRPLSKSTEDKCTCIYCLYYCIVFFVCILLFNRTLENKHGGILLWLIGWKQKSLKLMKVEKMWVFSYILTKLSVCNWWAMRSCF